MLSKFNIRVYGLLIVQESNQMILLSDETIEGQRITKFPGGGLEFGEGTIDCLRREFREELDLDIKELNHFYTTDFFQASAFSPRVQLISIYYTLQSSLNQDALFKHLQQLNQTSNQDREEYFYCACLDEVAPSQLTFPIDILILDKLKASI